MLTSVSPHYGKKEGGNQVGIKGTGIDPADFKVKFRRPNGVNWTRVTNCLPGAGCNESTNDDGVGHIDGFTTKPATGEQTINMDSTNKSADGKYGAVRVIVKNITNTNSGGISFGNGGFKYGFPSPTVTSIDPATGPISGGTSVMVRGTNFYRWENEAASVKIGGIELQNVNFTDPTGGDMYGTIVGTTGTSGWWVKDCNGTKPGVTGTPVNVKVTNPDGKYGQLADAFTYSKVDPQITGVSPLTGPSTGGTTVEVTGTNLNRIASIYFGPHLAPCNTISGTDNGITVMSPRGCGSQPIRIQTVDNSTATSTSLFTYTPVAPGSPSVSATHFTCANNATATMTATLNKGMRPCDDITLASYSITYVSGAPQNEIQVTSTPAVMNGDSTATIAFPLKFTNCPCGNPGLVTEYFKLTMNISTTSGSYGPFHKDFETETLPSACGSLSASATAMPATGPAPLTVNFTGAATGGLQPYSFSWVFGDGTSIPWQNPQHIYMAAGSYTAILTVSDAMGSTATANVSITVN